MAEAARIRASRSVLAMASDERLTQEMRRGSEAAFEAAYARYATGLLTLCRHILRCQEEAEEAVQHSFAAAWSDLQRPDRPPPERLKPWLYSVARHRCLSLLRDRKQETVPLGDVPSASGLSDEVGRRADLRALLSDLHELPEEQKTALVLSEIAGLSHADIADVLGRRESGIKSLVFQARTTLGDWREARDARCEDIREQLTQLRGGSLRRRPLRRHLQRCPSCRAFRAKVKAQRRGLAITLPVLPSFGLKRGVLAAAGLGAGAGGGGAGGGLSLALPSLLPLGCATLTAAGLGGGGETSAAALPPDVRDHSARAHPEQRSEWRPTTLAPASQIARVRARPHSGRGLRVRPRARVALAPVPVPRPPSGPAVLQAGPKMPKATKKPDLAIASTARDLAKASETPKIRGRRAVVPRVLRVRKQRKLTRRLKLPPLRAKRLDKPRKP